MNTVPALTMQDYLDAVRRRFGVLLRVAIPVVAGGVALALLLDDSYTSRARIDIDMTANVDTLEPIELTTYAEQYIAKLEDVTLETETLRPLVNETDLFDDPEGFVSEPERIAAVRDAVSVSLLTQPVTSPGGRTVDLITGFTVAATSGDPRFAYEVAKFMTQAFLDADVAFRTQVAGETATFLRDEMDRTEQEILEFEQDVADFKVVNACCLPELMDLNLSVIQRTQSEIESLQPRIRTLEQERAFKQAEMGEIRQQVASTGGLEELEAEYFRLVANYGPEHPDVLRVRREITAITGGAAAAEAGEAYELVELRIRLKEAEQRYQPEHPDIIRFRREIAELEAKQSNRRGGPSAEQARLLENPRYLQLRNELNAINTELSELRRREPELRAKIADYEGRLTRTPQIESDYQALQRRLQTARDNFEDLQGRLVVARQTFAVESNDISARLSEVRSASLRNSPSGPPRVAIGVIAFLFAGVLGVGMMILAEMTDSTVRSKKDVEMITEIVPIASIPVIAVSSQKSGGIKPFIPVVAATVAIVAVIYLLDVVNVY